MTTVVDSISEELNYTQTVSSHSSPQYVKVQSISNIVNFQPSITSVFSVTEFLLPNRVINLSKSRISFQIAFPAGGGGLYTYAQGNH